MTNRTARRHAAVPLQVPSPCVDTGSRRRNCASNVSTEMFTATVSRTRALTHDVREIELTLTDPAAMSFVPGQWVSFEIEREGSRLPATRAYSIASSPNRTNAIELVLNRVAD